MENVESRIGDDLSANRVVLYMKGNPGNSPCGYSSRMVAILDHTGVDYVTRDVLESEELRAGIKTWSGVKTLPQLFIDGKFAGGTDDIRELFEAETLRGFFNSLGIAVGPENPDAKPVIADVSRDEKVACASA